MHSMKIGLKFFAAALAVVLAVGCGSKEDSEEPEKPPVNGPVFEAGSWVLSQWNGSQELPRSIYLHLAADRSFELYQSLNTIGYSKYTGTYTVTVYEQKALLSGTYTDGTPWESSYVVESQTAELLRLRSQTAGNISQYVAAEIPDYVKDGITVKNVRAEAEKPFL